MPDREIAPKEAHSQLSAYRIIDVRQPHEFEGPLGRIAGSELIPLGAIAERAESLGDAGSILFICRSGHRSGLACDLLQKAGISDVTNLVGGMIAWNRASCPVERDRIESFDAILSSVASWLAQVTGKPIEEALSDLDTHLGEAGASRGALDADALRQTLERVATHFEAGAVPPDLDLTLSAFRDDLSAL